jgi:hypothetical protein
MTNTTRRAVMCGLAAAPVAALPVATAEADAAEKLMTAEDFAAFELEPWRADLLAKCEPTTTSGQRYRSSTSYLFGSLGRCCIKQNGKLSTAGAASTMRPASSCSTP